MTQKNTVTPISGELTGLIRKIGKSLKNIHPEIWAKWHLIAGEQMSRRTYPCFYSKKQLTLAVSSSAWLQQISMLKPMLIERLDEIVGPGVVTQIKLISDHHIAKQPLPRKEKSVEHQFQEPDLSKLPEEILSSANSIEDKELSLLIKQAAALYQKPNKD